MTKEKDARLLSPRRPDADRLVNLERAVIEVNRRLPERHKISIASAGGDSSAVVVVSDGAQAERGDYRRRAIEHARLVAPVLGMDPDFAELSADVAIAELSSGSRIVNLQQRHLGIPIFDAMIAVLFTPEGAIKRTSDKVFPTRRPFNELPRLSATEALVRAASHLAQPDTTPTYTDVFGQPVHTERLNLDGFTPRVISGFESPERAAVFEAGPFAEPIPGSLIWFPLNDELRLGWSFLLRLRDFQQK